MKSILSLLVLLVSSALGAKEPSKPAVMPIPEARAVDTMLYELGRERRTRVEAAIRKVLKEMSDDADIKKKIEAVNHIEQTYQMRFTNDPGHSPLKGEALDTVDTATGEIHRKAQ